MVIPMFALLLPLWTRLLREEMKTGITIALAMDCLAAILLIILMRCGVSDDWVRKYRKE